MTTKKSTLKNFNIENLFSSNNIKPHTNGKLDIHTLFNNTNEKSFVFDPNVLLNNTKKIKKNLENKYDDIFQGCCKTIMAANDAGLTDIFYEVPEHIIEIINYNPKLCMIYLKNKLYEHNIDSFILPKSKTKIFITWKNLEKKLYDNV
jgi:hypothetical protein